MLVIEVETIDIKFKPSEEAKHVPFWAISLIGSTIVFLLMFCFYRSRAYTPEPIFFYLLLSVVGSMAWIQLILGLIIDVLNLLKTITGLPELVLGMTIMAIGNSCTGKLI